MERYVSNNATATWRTAIKWTKKMDKQINLAWQSCCVQVEHRIYDVPQMNVP